MADLRDRYRRDYRSVPIPTPPRQAPARRPVDIKINDTPGAPPVPKQSATAALQTPVSPPQPVNPPPAPQPQTAPPIPQQPISQPQPATPTAQTPATPTQKPLEPSYSQTQAEYDSQPERPSRAAKKAQKRANKQAGRHKRSKFKTFVLWPLLVIVILALLGSAAYAGWYEYQQRQPLPIDRSYVKNASFPVYLPDSLPQGYAIDKTTLDTQDNALVFTIKNSQDSTKIAAVSEQKLPANFNPDKQLPDNPAGAGPEDRKFTSAIGKVEVATFQDNLVASIGTPKTWIIINISTLPTKDADAIAKSFRSLGPTSPWQPIQDKLNSLKKKI